MIKEFSLITNKDPSEFQSSWENIEDRVLKFAEIEEKRKVKSLLKQYNSSDGDNTPGKTFHQFHSSITFCRPQNNLRSSNITSIVLTKRSNLRYFFPLWGKLHIKYLL